MSEELTLQADKPHSVPATPAAPVAGGERIDAIDKLRGIAVAGILVMNIYGFAMPFAAYSNPLAHGGTDAINMGTWFFTHIFFDQKFLPIFSMLFGAGLVMMFDRAEARGAKFGGIWYRRNFWLLLFGIAHAWLIWMGDILFHYALVGMLIYPFRKLSPRTLIIIGCLVFPVALGIVALGSDNIVKLQGQVVEIQQLEDAGETLSEEQLELREQWAEMSKMIGPPEESVREDLAAYRSGYIEILAFRAPTAQMMETKAAFAFVIWRAGGIMFLGMALMKLGVLSGERSNAFYRKMMGAGYVVGLPLVLFSAWDLNAHQWDGAYMFAEGIRANYVGSVFMSLGHVAVFMLIIRNGKLQNLMRRFAAIGRMALTNYLMHSVVLTTIFYGYGFGIYGTVPRIWQMGFVVAMVSFQLWYSPIWLQRYRFGPVEWLWRSLTYWQRQPMRRALPQG